MAVNREHFTFIWNIRNFSFGFNTRIFHSPSFFVDEISGTEWHLILGNNKDNVCCWIQRLGISGPDEVQLDYELSFLAKDESVLLSEMFVRKEYKKGYTDSQSTLRAEKDEILIRNKDLFVPDDTLIIRCRMWNSKKTIARSRKCFAETLLKTECRSFVGTIGKFSSLEPNCRTLVCIKSSASKNFFSSVVFCTNADGKLGVEVKPMDCSHLYKYICKLFILDRCGNKVKSGHGEFQEPKTQCIPLTLPKEHLMENKEYYLPNDVLNIECEIIFPTGDTKEKICESGFEHRDIQETISLKVNCSSHERLITLKDNCISQSSEEILSNSEPNIPSAFPDEHLIENKGNFFPDDVPVVENECICSTSESVEKIDEPECKLVCEETQRIISNEKEITLLSKDDSEKETSEEEVFTTLKDDWASLFSEGTLSDVKLRTATETLSVHKAVLIARSPVFWSMFTTDMREKKQSFVEINDVDADTMRRMLSFMYSDTLDDLDYESTKSLYFAADKYCIISLKRRCASLLKQMLLQSNCCDVLLLAVQHNDKDLKNDVQEYIEESDSAIFLSDEWKNLEESHPRLTTQIFHTLYMKKRGN
ncbi:uncharacterized protein LOC129989372 [Argiope bruennichi]|uniref:uncharacterized protein LOC129989372 n=1 Tax=Argiope bruennichi TaxID=94029 RepID=UPI00249480B5|nr:uncharacterized protein LOC129989372 [Argiope bruennichi]